MTEQGPWWRSPAVIGAAVASVAVVVADAAFRAAGGTPGEPVLFLGRFHPLAVHLPIGVILLVAAAEALSFFPKLRARVDPAIGLTLPLLALSAFGAFILGHMLARDGGFAPRALTLHRRLELLAVIGTCLSLVAWTYYEKSETARGRTIYRAVFGTTLAVLSIGAHFGGTLTRGETYLSRYAPSFLKPLLGGEEAAAKPAPKPTAPSAEPLVFADVVLPLLKERCAGCHGAEKVKGGLRVDSLEAIRRGGENGSAVVPGDAHGSQLYARTVLPVEDDDRMPPEGKPGPTPAELALLRFWIERGADEKLRVRDALAPLESRELLEKAVGTAGTPKPSTPTNAAPTDAKPDPPEPAPAPTATGSTSGSPLSESGANAGETPPRASDTPATPSQTPLPEPASTEAAPSGRSARAILNESCVKCHGPEKQKGKLRVDSLAAMLRGGSNGAAVIPGNPDRSSLIAAVRSPVGAEGHMPPKKEPQLSAGDIATLAAWVRALSAPAKSGAEEREPATPKLATDSKPSPTTEPANAGNSEPASPATPPNPMEANEPPADAAPVAGNAPPPDLSKVPARFALFHGAVMPLLKERCGQCHAGKGAGQLSIDSYERLMAGGSSGAAVVAGQPDRSLLIQRVELPLSDGDHMPPEGDPQLTGDEIAVLRHWVERGAALDLEANLSDLPAAAQRGVALRPPPPLASHADTAAVPPDRAGGCGACSVGSHAAQPVAPVAIGFGLALSLALRRRRRRG